MLRLYPEQLLAHINEKISLCYWLIGQDLLLLQESQDTIRKVATQQGFNEYHHMTIDSYTDWSMLFGLCQERSLFSTRQILILQLPDTSLSTTLHEHLSTLFQLRHADILFILRVNRLTKSLEESAWFKTLNNESVIIRCHTPEHTQLPQWLARRAKKMKLTLDHAASQLLCHCYEGNLLALNQSLEHLFLLYPDGKLTLPRVEHAVNDVAQFTPNHWLDALWNGKSKRARYILQQLRLEEREPLILLRTVQRELLQLINLKRKITDQSLRTLFDNAKIWQNRRPLLTHALQRLSTQHLHLALSLLVDIELSLKQEYEPNVWDKFENLSMLLCGKQTLESLPYGSIPFN